MQITGEEIAWAFRVAPPLARQIALLWNEVFSAGVTGRDPSWNSSWDTVFRARVDIFETTLNIYMISKVYRLLAAEVHTVVVYPGGQNAITEAPESPRPFRRE